MSTPDQVYKTHINVTPEKVWAAITNPEFTRQYWFGNANVAAKWEKGGTWNHKGMDSATVYHSGVIEECIPNQRLVITWDNKDDANDMSRVTFEITPKDGGSDLIIIHGDFIAGSSMAGHVAGGWPKVIGNMKEWLETGKVTSLEPPCDHKAA